MAPLGLVENYTYTEKQNVKSLQKFMSIHYASYHLRSLPRDFHETDVRPPVEK